MQAPNQKAHAIKKQIIKLLTIQPFNHAAI